jgi:hypothetical protein
MACIAHSSSMLGDGYALAGLRAAVETVGALRLDDDEERPRCA